MQKKDINLFHLLFGTSKYPYTCNLKTRIINQFIPLTTYISHQIKKSCSLRPFLFKFWSVPPTPNSQTQTNHLEAPQNDAEKADYQPDQSNITLARSPIGFILRYHTRNTQLHSWFWYSAKSTHFTWQSYEVMIWVVHLRCWSDTHFFHSKITLTRCRASCCDCQCLFSQSLICSTSFLTTWE